MRYAVAGALLLTGLSAQRARTIVPTAPGTLVVEPPREDPGKTPELGVRAQLIESPNLDRFLRRAQEFLHRADFAGAIAVLQDAIEGRVVRDSANTAEPSPNQPGTGDPARATDDPFTDEDDPGKAVYSADSRLYRPVLRLCHELLASMPAEGLELYRTRFEVEAERQFAAALATRDQAALEALARRYFATDAAARALAATADLLLDVGRYKAAADVLRVLRHLHPRFAGGDGLPGLSPLDIDVELALCHRFAQEPEATAALLTEIGVRYAGASVRLLGDSVPVTALPAHPVFSDAASSPPSPPPSADDVPTAADFDALMPLWQRLFVDTKPYAAPTASSNTRGFVVMGEGGASGAVPLARLAEPGNRSVRFGERLVYLEHNRLRVHELSSGRLLLEGDGATSSYRVQSGQLAPRVASYDFAAMQVTGDRDRFYAVLVPARALPGAAAVLENRLVALDADTLTPRWLIGHGGEDTEFRATTFLAAPTVFHDRLLLPVLARGVYGVQCLDARTGASLFRTSLHSGGTDLVRAPGCPVVVDRDTAFVLTNAGVIAAIDAYSGVVRWLRRYERLDPFRVHATPRLARERQARFGVSVTTATSLPGFQFPSEILLRDGKLLLAPTDGRCLLSLDAASGEIAWLTTPKMTDYVLGADGENIYLAGKRLVCVQMRTGIQLWDIEVPESAQGRGVLVGDLVVMPGDRRLYLLATGGNATWQVSELPRFVQGQEVLTTRPNLSVFGAYVVATHAAGVEVFGLVRALRARAAAAADPFERARLLQHAGDLPAAIETLLTGIAASTDSAQQQRGVRELLPLVHEVALATTTVQQREPALLLLDRLRAVLTAREDVEAWHLTRIEVFRALHDESAAAAELNTLRALALAAPK
jgi:outer membrane protein assembly factor BamB/tetratricopeptide (TPR) repeat protein